MKPKYQEIECPICGYDAVALVTDDGHIGQCKVIWCEHGDVTIVNLDEPPIKVYDFANENKTTIIMDEIQ